MRSFRSLDLILEHLSILACPACGAELEPAPREIGCSQCRARYPIGDEGIPLLFCPNEGWTDRRDVTDMVKSFYEENPFPNYDDLDSRESLARKARQGVFARLLDQQIPAGSLVLEAGCGTGQLTNFLGLSWKRKVFGSDVCLNSLRLAHGFRERYSIHHTGFLQMNLFRPVFRPETFDVVICNGVLHHTGDPAGGFRSLARLVKPGGVILFGLYNWIGRLTTDLRRHLFRGLGSKVNFLDGHLRNKNYNEARKRAWFMDQYRHPHESKHPYSEALQWLESEGFQYLLSIPKVDGSPFSPEEKLFEPHDRGSRWTRLMTEVEMLMGGGVDGALYITIGRKPPRRQPEAAPAPRAQMDRVGAAAG